MPAGLSLVDRAEANLSAIETLWEVLDENRQATDEEKTLMACYTGWGTGPGMLEPLCGAKYRSLVARGVRAGWRV